MKKMKKTLKFLSILLLTFAFGTITWSCSNGDTEEEITIVDQLPIGAQTFLNQYFQGYQIVRVIKNNDNPVWYEVEFRGGGEVKFNAHGEWYDVEADRTLAIPKGFYPTPIDSYVSSNYPNAYIEEIQRINTGYEVDLNNDIDLIFNTNGDFISIQK